MKTPSFAVLTMASVEKLPQKERITQFAELAGSGQRIFSSLGKLMFAISSNLTAKQTIFGVLQKAGVKKGTVSNASYASKVYELVRDSIFTEAEYDTFGHRDCVAIVKAISSGSARRLSTEELAIVVRDSKDFEPELACLYEHGITLAEKDAADKQAEADRIAAETAAAAPAPTPNPAAPVEPVKAAGTAPAPAPETPAPAAAADPVEPGKVMPFPTAEPTVEDFNKLVDTLEGLLIRMSPELQRQAADRLLALADIVTGLIAPKPGKKVAAVA